MSSSSAVTPRPPLSCLRPRTMLGKGAGIREGGIREGGDYDRLKHQLNSVILGTREWYYPRELHFQDYFLLTQVDAAVRRDANNFSPPLSGIPTLFLGPELLPLVWSCSGKIHVLALLARMALVRLSWGWVRLMGQCWVAPPCLHFMQVWNSLFLVRHCQSGRAAAEQLEQLFWSLGWIFHLPQKTRNHKLAK